MKIRFLLIIFGVYTSFAFSQDLTISGTVNNPLGQIDISIPSDSINISFNADSSGNFYYVFGSLMTSSGMVYISAHCPNYILTDSVFFQVPDTVNIFFNCSNTYACNAQFSYSQNGSTFSFSESSATNDPGGIISYSWDFGDGNSSTLQNPTHTYSGPGTYFVSLSIQTQNGCSDSKSSNISIAGPPDCNPSFYYTLLGNDKVEFYPADSIVYPNYLWTFGDGDSSTDQSPIHTYIFQDSAYFSVCLTISDTTINCDSTFCDSILVYSLPSCQADFSYYSVGRNYYFRGSVSGGPVSPVTYVWDFGDGTTVTNINDKKEFHAFDSTGTYTVCLEVYDNVSSCMDTICKTITVQEPASNGTCVSTFSYQQQPGLNVRFVIDSNSSPYNTLYTWHLGNGDSLITANDTTPPVQYNQAGTYSVCVVAGDTIPPGIPYCADTICQNVTINPLNLEVSGYAFLDSATVINEGLVYLIEHDIAAGTLTAIDTATIYFSTYYTFYNVSPGNYFIKVALEPTDPSFSNFLPTYLGNKSYWADADSITVVSSNVLAPPITLLQGSNPGGPGFIGGLITQGANKAEGDPLEGINVLLMDASDEPQGHTLTDVNGEYSFDNLALGVYKVFPEIPGKTTNPVTIELTAGNPSSEEQDFEVNENSINPISTRIGPELNLEGISVYPVPVSQTLFAEVESDELRKMVFSLRNMLGQEVMSKAENILPGNQRISFDISALPNGNYILLIQSDQGFARRKVIIQR